MRSAAPPVAFLAIALGLAVACSSSSDDGTTPSGDDDAGSTSSSGSSGASSSSSSSSGSSSGSSGGGDAGTDAADASDGGGGRDLSTDKSKFLGASRCATSGLQLCEDFESGTLDKTIWSVVGTAPVIDGMKFARGAKALHITMNSNGASYIKETKTFPATNNTYWGRAFIYFASLPTVSGAFNYAHWTFAAASGTGVAGEIRLSGQLQDGKNLFGVGTDNKSATGTGDWTNSDKDPMNMPAPVPTATWMCIEWEHNGAANETKFYWDAVEHPSLATTTTKHGTSDGLGANPYVLPTFNAVWVGWQEYQTQPNEKWEMWVDEIGIDPKRIGCVQ